MADDTKAHNRFNQVMLEFAELLKDTVHYLHGEGLTDVTPSKIELVITFLETLLNADPTKLINTFITYSTENLNEDNTELVTCWHQIHNRDEEFFVEHCQKIFRDVPLVDPKKHISTFKMLFTTYYINRTIRLLLRPGDAGYNTAEPIDLNAEYRIVQSAHGHIIVDSGHESYDQGEPIVNPNLRYVEREAKFAVPKETEGAQSVLSDEEKQNIWAYFDALISISINYIHLGRKPKIKTIVKEITKDDGTVEEVSQKKPAYGANFMTEVKGLGKYAKMFGVKLNWQ